MTLENLLRIGKLKPHKTTHEEIARLLTAMRRNLKDAHNTEISPESRFDIAYKAAKTLRVRAQFSLIFARLTEHSNPTRLSPRHRFAVGWASLPLSHLLY